VNGQGAKKKTDQRLGSFVLVDELPSGGKARVFRSLYSPETRDPSISLSPGDHAVLKILRDSSARDARASSTFSRESELLSMVEHPNVVRGITRGVTGGRMWNAVEYIEGEDLGTLLSVMRTEQVRLRPHLVASIAADILAGLAAAQSIADHRGRSLGLIHRNLSPKQVMIDLRGQAKLIDFSDALLSLQEEPGPELVGTFGYLSPEQAKKEQLTQGVDVYQVGLLMFELLTGERAFPIQNATDDAILKTHAGNKRAPWPRSTDVPIEIKAVIDAALGPTPEDRPADAAAFYAQVEGLIESPDEARQSIALVIRDLVRSDPEKPDPLYV